MNEFRAGVQYNDLVGTVAADRSDNLSFLNYLKEEGLAGEGELLIGFRVAFSENHSHEMPNPGLVVYLHEAEEFVKNPENARAVEVDMPIARFFSFFKRFDLVMTNKGLELDGTSVDGPHYD